MKDKRWLAVPAAMMLAFSSSPAHAAEESGPEVKRNRDLFSADIRIEAEVETVSEQDGAELVLHLEGLDSANMPCSIHWERTDLRVDAGRKKDRAWEEMREPDSALKLKISGETARWGYRAVLVAENGEDVISDMFAFRTNAEPADAAEAFPEEAVVFVEVNGENAEIQPVTGENGEENALPAEEETRTDAEGPEAFPEDLPAEEENGQEDPSADRTGEAGTPEASAPGTEPAAEIAADAVQEPHDGDGPETVGETENGMEPAGGEELRVIPESPAEEAPLDSEEAAGDAEEPEEVP